MTNPTFFVQECPTCGRSLEVRVAYLGRQVICQHCRGEFVANDSVLDDPSSSGSDLLRRADELLELAAKRRPRRAR